MLKHERKNQYGGHKSGVVDRILACRMVIEVMKLLRILTSMVARIAILQTTIELAI